jgi:5-oxoprolinase (ATP-hydrolysing)
LQAAYDDGILSGAIVFLHGYRYPEHEKRMATIAKEIGFIQISVSHEVSALMKIVSQGDTNEIISFLTPGH